MKRALGLSIVLFMAFASPAVADEATVDAQVTVDATCITVSPSAIDYGDLKFTVDVPEPGLGTIAYENCSAVPEDVHVRGTAASSLASGASWTLGSLDCIFGSETNVYSHGVDQLHLTTINQLLASDVAAGTVQDVETSLQMPCTGSDGLGETFTFSIIFTAVGS